MIFLHQYLWIAGTALCAVTLFCGFWKKRVDSFPLFFVFLGWPIVAFLVQFPIQYLSSVALWRWCTFLVIEISFLFELAMLYQLAMMLIFSHSLLAKRLRPLLGKILAILILLAVFVAVLLPADSTFVVRRLLNQLSVAQDFLELGFLFTLVLFTRVLALSWRSLPAGVALGWSISSSVNIAAMLLLRHIGASFYMAADTLRLAGFYVCILVWFRYVAVPEPAYRRSIPNYQIAEFDREANELQTFMRS
jgi:hypothetical protein